MKHQVYSYLFLIAILCSGCAAKQQLQLQKEVSPSIALGVIIKREGTLKNNVEIKGLPALPDKLRLSVTETPFSRSMWTRYQKGNAHRPDTQKKTDSLTPQATYFEVELVDDIRYMAAVNKDQATLTYLRNSKKGGAITQIAMVPDQPIQREAGTHFFLEDIGDATYAIGIYKKGARVGQVLFSEMTVFGYQPSYFCFGENERKEAVVMEVAEEGKSCKRPLHKKAKKAVKERSIYDY